MLVSLLLRRVYPIRAMPLLRCVSSLPENTVVAHDRESSESILSVIACNRDRVFACDTEVVDIDIEHSPIGGNGRVVCASLYCGPDVSFSAGCSRVWIDNNGQSEGTLSLFRPFFEDAGIRKVWHNYSFDKHVLSNHGIMCRGFYADTMHMARLLESTREEKGGFSLESLSAEYYVRKRPMKELFGHRKLKKDGSEAVTVHVPDVLTLQTDDQYRRSWIEYSVFDAEATWFVREELSKQLRKLIWSVRDGVELTMQDFYERHLRPFGELLTEMEWNGIKMDLPFLHTIEERALSDQCALEKSFRDWLSHYVGPESYHLNVNSSQQKQQVLFAPCTNVKTGESLPREREFIVENTEGRIEPGKKKALKTRKMKLSGLGLPATELTQSGWPSVTSSSLQLLSGKPESEEYGPAYDFFGGGAEGKSACIAIVSLATMSNIDTMIHTFIQPLQTLSDKNHRIHGSLNLNTETGRLSSRGPNLQNQPALEKDRYMIRKAFTCEPGNILLVSDYAQLELRVLAHMTRCKSMLDAFRLGGDFHSRTAYNMYDYIQEAVKNGTVKLEKGDSSADLPLVKQVYHSERRKAKILNFSIAYGKTAQGLSKDFGVSLTEAKDTLAKWYRDRPEVYEWQQETIRAAQRTGYTRTLMGRYRKLPDIRSSSRLRRNHSERAAINTPIQGGAADIVMMAMLKIQNDMRLRDMGFKMLLQVHDEVMLEGPEEHAEAAMACLREDMEHPFERPLLVELLVDGGAAKTWYEAK